MPASDIGSVDTMELESLMKEFPDWKEQFPEMLDEINPPRYSKANRKDRQKQDRIIPRKQSTPPQTDYQATFSKKNSRPRSTKRPPPSPRDPNPPPMKFDTNQRMDYTPKDLGARAKLIVKEENYEQPSGNVESKSQYAYDFPGHFVLPEIHRHNPSEVKGNIKKTTGKFLSQTTNKEHYKKWVPERSLQFGELPSFTGSLLYPEKDRQLESTNMATYRGKVAPKPEMAKMADGNLKIEGDRDFNTTNAVTFKSFDGAKPAEKVNFSGDISVVRKAKFNGETQTMSDFKNYGGRNKRAMAIEPPQPSIDLKFDNRRTFDTEQRKQFTGIDTSKHKVADPFVPADNSYKAPTEKFETLTSQKIDFKPFDVTDHYSPPKKGPQDQRRKDKKPKLDDMTMNKLFFKKWDVEPRKVYGDFHEGHTYVPPVDKFNTQSTTQETYKGKSAPIPDSFKPESKAIDADGEQDFNTVYKVTFSQPSGAKRLTRQQKAALYKELKKRKGGPTGSQPLAV